MKVSQLKHKPQTLVKKSGRDRDGNPIEVTIKDGVSVEHTEKHFNSPCMGMSKGVTVNMGDYQSLRVDVWLSLPLSNTPDRKEISQTYAKLVDYIDRILDEEIDKETGK